MKVYIYPCWDQVPSLFISGSWSIFNPKKRVELVKVGIYPSWDQVQYLFIPLEAGLYSALKKGWNFVKGLYLSLLGSGAVFTGLYSALIKRWNGLKVCWHVSHLLALSEIHRLQASHRMIYTIQYTVQNTELQLNSTFFRLFMRFVTHIIIMIVIRLALFVNMLNFFRILV